MIGNFDDTGHVFSLFKQPDGTPSQNSGSIVLAKGPDYPSNGMTGLLVNMESPYGWDAVSQSYKFDNVNDFVQTDPKVNSNTLTLSTFAKLNGANNSVLILMPEALFSIITLLLISPFSLYVFSVSFTQSNNSRCFAQ